MCMESLEILNLIPSGSNSTFPMLLHIRASVHFIFLVLRGFLTYSYLSNDLLLCTVSLYTTHCLCIYIQIEPYHHFIIIITFFSFTPIRNFLSNSKSVFSLFHIQCTYLVIP